MDCRLTVHCLLRGQPHLRSRRLHPPASLPYHQISQYASIPLRKSPYIIPLQLRQCLPTITRLTVGNSLLLPRSKVATPRGILWSIFDLHRHRRYHQHRLSLHRSHLGSQRSTGLHQRLHQSMPPPPIRLALPQCQVLQFIIILRHSIFRHTNTILP